MVDREHCLTYVYVNAATTGVQGCLGKLGLDAEGAERMVSAAVAASNHVTYDIGLAMTFIRDQVSARSLSCFIISMQAEKC